MSGGGGKREKMGEVMEEMSEIKEFERVQYKR